MLAVPSEYVIIFIVLKSLLTLTITAPVGDWNKNCFAKLKYFAGYYQKFCFLLPVAWKVCLYIIFFCNQKYLKVQVRLFSFIQPLAIFSQPHKIHNNLRFTPKTFHIPPKYKKTCGCGPVLWSRSNLDQLRFRLRITTFLKHKFK